MQPQEGHIFPLAAIKWLPTPEVSYEHEPM